MTINYKKCGLILHKGIGLKDNKNRFLNNYLDIPIVNEYKYLGIYIDKNLNFKKQLEYMEKKMKKAEKIINIAHWKKIPIW